MVCVMNTHKTVLSSLSTRALLTRRRRLAARLGEVKHVLAGSLVEQTRRCGKPDCRCVAGEPHGPYAYFAPPGRARAAAVRAGGAGRGGACPLRRGEQVQAVLAEISAINAELLTRRELE
jgi:hypothetical protein